MSVHLFHLANEEPTFSSELNDDSRGQEQLPGAEHHVDCPDHARPWRIPGRTETAANALGYCTAGRLLVTIFNTGNQHSIFVIDPGQTFFVPAGACTRSRTWPRKKPPSS